MKNLTKTLMFIMIGLLFFACKPKIEPPEPIEKEVFTLQTLRQNDFYIYLHADELELDLDNIIEINNFNTQFFGVYDYEINFLNNGTNTLTANGKNIKHIEVGYYAYAGDIYDSVTALNVTKLKNLYILDCNNNLLTELDLSQNTNLRYLTCNDNQLTSVKLNSPVIYWVYLHNNQLSAAALNEIFYSLPDVNDFVKQRVISISNNPGTETCDKSIAENKGWIVDVYEYIW